MSLKSSMKFYDGFAKFDAACKSRHMSNLDQAVLLGVSPVMISRYRSDRAAMPYERAKSRLQQAARVLSAIDKSKQLTSRTLPNDRLQIIVDSMESLGVDVKLPVGVERKPSVSKERTV